MKGDKIIQIHMGNDGDESVLLGLSDVGRLYKYHKKQWKFIANSPLVSKDEISTEEKS